MAYVKKIRQISEFSVYTNIIIFLASKLPHLPNFTFYGLSQKLEPLHLTVSMYIMFHNPVKNEPIIIIFGTKNPEETH